MKYRDVARMLGQLICRTRGVSLPMLLAAALTCGLTFGAGSRPLGSIAGWGQYSVDHMPSPPGTLVFAGDLVATEAGSGVQIRFTSGSIARLEAATELALNPGDVELRQGTVTLKTAGGEPRRVRALGAAVMLDGSGSPSLCSLQVKDGALAVAVEQGSATIVGAGAPIVLAAGHAARLAVTSPQQAGQRPEHIPPLEPNSTGVLNKIEGIHSIGRVIGEYSDVIVRHPGAEIATPLRLGELVDAGDVIGTLVDGRARVQLFDNTLVDAGVGTTLKLIAHDPIARTTEVRINAGELRAQIPPIEGNGPQPRFVIGSESLQVTAAPTTLFVSLGPKESAVCNVASGVVTVKSPSGAAAPVNVAPGECSVMRPGEAPGASHADTARMERLMEVASFESAPGIPQLAKRENMAKARTAVYSGAAVLSLVVLTEVPSIPKNFNAGAEFSASITAYLNALNATVLNSEAAIEVEHQLCLSFLQYAIEMGKTISPSLPAQVCPNP